MVITSAQPSLSELYGFIDRVRTYPISVKGLLGLAQRDGAPKEIVEFFRTFSPETVFTDSEELTASSEQVEIMRGERVDMPREEENTEEY